MKKNTMMRIASCLLIAVLMTTCVISGTFAKYVSETAAVSDTARVAEWGWNGSNALTVDLFDETAFGDTGVNGAAAVVAPGTSHTATVTFAPAAEFSPEVAYKINYVVDAECDTNLEARMTWTLKAPGAANATPYDTIEELETAIEAITANYAPNTVLAQTFEIGWAWVFETDADTSADGMQADPALDANDTALGNEAMVNLDSCSISIKLVVTQLDTYTAP